jgi:multidrug efflux pump subunit AcrA (membrane-fusion protein)
MAKCARCNKSGIFFKVNAERICKECERIIKLEQEETNLKQNIEKLQNELQDTEKAYKKIADQAKADINKKYESKILETEQLQKEIENKKNEILVHDETIMLESFALYKPKFKFQTSEDYKIRLEKVRAKQKELIKTKHAAWYGVGWTVNGSASEGKKMVNDMVKLVLRSFNNECDYCVDNVTFNNIEASVNRIEKSFEAINKLGKICNVSIHEDYKKLKFDELSLAFEYQQKKQQEKEEAKKAREELREQQKLDREIKEAREKILKERKHFNTAIKDFEAKLKKVTDENERLLMEKNIAETRAQLAELDKEEKVIDYREQNAKAGYVYIISNIGAFGEGVYKIGMTRRLEPMDRIDELGDASVPFSFDVHAMIFSDNAPALEAKLHEHFYQCRINKINNRKEFYRADLNEIEKILKENYEKIVDVVKEAPAEQYRESLLIK